MNKTYVRQWTEAKGRLTVAIQAAGCTHRVLSQMNDAAEALEVIAIFKDGSPLTVITARFMFNRNHAPSIFLFMQESSVARLIGLPYRGEWKDTSAMLEKLAAVAGEG